MSLDMSQRTLARFMYGQSVPTRLRALGMLAALTHLPAELYHPLADALAIASHERPLLRAPSTSVAAPVAQLPVDRAGEETALTLMLYVTAEANGVAPGAARKVALALLDHLTARGLDVATGREVTRAAEKRLAGKRG
jgi:hypothetical protein